MFRKRASDAGDAPKKRWSLLRRKSASAKKAANAFADAGAGAGAPASGVVALDNQPDLDDLDDVVEPEGEVSGGEDADIDISAYEEADAASDPNSRASASLQHQIGRGLLDHQAQEVAELRLTARGVRGRRRRRIRRRQRHLLRASIGIHAPLPKGGLAAALSRAEAPTAPTR